MTKLQRTFSTRPNKALRALELAKTTWLCPDTPKFLMVGDTAAFEQEGKTLPGVAQVVTQQRRYAGKLMRNCITCIEQGAPFRYLDKGNMPVVGKAGEFASLTSSAL